MKMKTVCLTIALMIGATCVSAQKGGQQPGDMAKQRAEEMKKELNLTDKQYNELYSLFQSEEKERSSKMQGMQPSGEDGQTGASKQAKEQKGNTKEQKAQNSKKTNSKNANATEGKPERPQMSAEMEAQMKKDMEQRDAKVKKILTTEQYNKWKKSEANRQPQQNGKKAASK